MNRISGTQIITGILGLLFAAGCSSSSDADSQPNAGPDAAGSSAINTFSPCRGTITGVANGEFTCKSYALLFTPTYQSDTLRNNTEFTFGSATKYDMGMSPPGVEFVLFAGVFPGELKPGTYTEAQLLKTELDAHSVRLEDGRTIDAVKRLSLVINSITPGDLNGDVVTGRGQTRSDSFAGSIEMVMGEAPNEVTISGVMK
jgi:hypothetical protein